jgi:LuxR family transcriptional regulator
MTTLLDFVERTTTANSVEAVWSGLTEAMAGYGFDRLIYGFTRYRSSESLGNPEDLLILTNHDRRYMDRYLGENLYVEAPMVRWAAENTGACSWSWIRENYEHLTPGERKVADFNQQCGVTAGYTISFPGLSMRQKGAIAVTARQGFSQAEVDALWRIEGRIIEQMATVAHLKIITLPYTGSRRPLTDRQREVLEWVGDGKTTQDIATIMGLTVATVEKHLRLARDVLDVDTTAQAVVKASFQNQIFVVPH